MQLFGEIFKKTPRRIKVGMTYNKIHQVTVVCQNAVKCKCINPHSWHPIGEDGNVDWYKVVAPPVDYKSKPKKIGLRK